MMLRRFRKQAVVPSLFPFLAVLVCTMGALIVLLVLVVQQAGVDAAMLAQQRSDAERQRLADHEEEVLEQEDFEWQREIYDQQRTELTEEVADGRLELSHLEDHLRDLEVRLQRLKSEAAELLRIRSEENGDTVEALAKLEHLKNEIAAANRRLEDARREAVSRPQTFAIVPYDGMNGTKRRPIYIECTERGIIIQPEGVVLTRRDLGGPLGPGNPLDAALRTVREHWAQHGGLAQGSEPYPLLIVRPNGTLAYNYAREALRSWDDEFGYELIDEDVLLEYPKPDRVLGDRLLKTIKDARHRQAILIAAMPNQFGGSAAGGFVATTPRGGFRAINDGRSGQSLDEAGSGTNGESTTDGPGESSFRVGTGQQTGSATNSESDQAVHPQQPGTANGSAPGSGGAPASIAQQRGTNWALPKAARGATGYQIPVRVDCQYDRLTILPRPSERSKPTVVAAADPLRQTVDEFVKVLWQQVDGWDAAPVGGYWQPVLEVYVYPGAEGRFVELQRLLKGSGIQVQRQAK